MKRIHQLEDQPIDISSVSHVVSWFVPLPTLLPVQEAEIFTFWSSGTPLDGGQRIVIRLLSADGQSQELTQIGELMKISADAFNITPRQNDIDLNSILAELGRRQQTIAEVAAFIDLRDGEQDDTVRAAFDYALEHVRQIQHAVFAVDKVPPPLLTTQSLPSMVPYSIHSISGEEPSLDLGCYLIPSVMSAQSHWYRSTGSLGEADDQLPASSLIHASLDRQIANGPFVAYSELINEAQVAALNSGLPRAAALAAASAGEVLLDEALRCVLWESGSTPEEAGKLFANERDFKPRTTKQLPRYLGGTWKLKGDGVIARWFNDVYRLRHRIVHAGENPSNDDVQSALSTTFELNEFLADRLSNKVNLYPRSTMFFLGVPGLERRRLWTNRLQELSLEPNEPHWASTFSRWRKSLEVAREMTRSRQSLKGDLKSAYAIFWVHTTGSFKWVLFDPNTYATAQVDIGQLTGIPATEVEQADQYIELARIGALDTPRMKIFESARSIGTSTLEWQLPYRNLPMLNVMVDGSEQKFQAT